MKTYLIPEELMQSCNQHADFEPRGLEKGDLAIYCKNTEEYVVFKNAQKSTTHYAWVAQRENLPDYFLHTIKEL